MGKQTNQYTKTRTAATTQSDDLLDIDSTEDTGTTFESAKMKVSELLAYINANVNNLYRIDGSLTGSRNVTLDNHTLSFVQGKIRFKSTGGDIPFSLDNSSGVERVKLEYFTTQDSGSLTLSNAAGNFFNSVDGESIFYDSSGDETLKILADGSVRFSYSTAGKVMYFGNNGRIQSSTSGNARLTQMDLFNCGLLNTLDANNQIIHKIENIGLGSYTFGGGTHTLAITNGTAPTSDPLNGGYVYSQGGALMYRGSAGTITTLGPA